MLPNTLGQCTLTNVTAGQPQSVNIAPLPTCSIVPASPTVPVGANAVFTASPTGVGPFAYCWRKACPGAGPCLSTRPTLSINNARPSDSGCYELTVTDHFGCTTTCRANLTVLPGPNLPPTSCVASIVPAECTIIASDGTVSVISVNGTHACVALQGSATDPEGEALTYSWWTNGVVFASGATATQCFELGCHAVTFLALDPAEASCTATLNVCVISPSDAVEQCIDLVETTPLNRKNKRSLIATLKAAAASFERGNVNAAFNQLHAFENKVRAQIATHNPAAAQAFLDCAQNILNAVTCANSHD
jgi:hypothetical protein